VQKCAADSKIIQKGGSFFASHRFRREVIDLRLTLHTMLLSMGLFDTLAKQAIGSFFGGNAGHSSDLLSSLLNQAGGLPGLMQKFNQSGLSDVFASWVSTGENKPVQPAQLEQALGSDAVADLSRKLGIDSNTVLPLISQFLPQVIDKLTPNGVVEDAPPTGDQLQNVLASVMKGGLGNLFGGRA
jgi:uncharacterized protein YidB (DUF937 family)